MFAWNGCQQSKIFKMINSEIVTQRIELIMKNYNQQPILEVINVEKSTAAGFFGF
jgi:hypothetical protein